MANQVDDGSSPPAGLRSLPWPNHETTPIWAEPESHLRISGLPQPELAWMESEPFARIGMLQCIVGHMMGGGEFHIIFRHMHFQLVLAGPAEGHPVRLGFPQQQRGRAKQQAKNIGEISYTSAHCQRILDALLTSQRD